MLNRRNNHAMTAYDPFREMDNFERHFFEDPFGVFFSNDSQSAFKTVLPMRVTLTDWKRTCPDLIRKIFMWTLTAIG